MRVRAGWYAGGLLGLMAVVALTAMARGEEPAWRRLTSDGRAKERPLWHPDGRRILLARETADAMQYLLYLVDPEQGGEGERVTRRNLPEYHGAYAPDGRRLRFVAVSQVGTQGDLDIAALDEPGSEAAVVLGNLDGKLSHQDWPDWKPDGTAIAFSSTQEGNQEIHVSTPAGQDAVRLTQSPGIDAHPCWTPDGQSLVFATERWGGLELARMGADGGAVERLTTSRGLDDYPAVSPDGRRVAFVSNRDGQQEIYVMGIDGSAPRNVTRSPARESFPAWSPDGRRLLFTSDRAGGIDVYELVVDP